MKNFLLFALFFTCVFFFTSGVNQLNAQTIVKTWGFETAMEDWTSGDGAASIAISSDRAYEGTKSLKLVGANNHLQINLQNDVFEDVKETDTIKYRIWISATELANVNGFQVFWQNTAGWAWNSQWFNASDVTGDQWSTIAFKFPAIALPLQRIGLQVLDKDGMQTATPTIYVDAITIVRASQLPVELTSFTATAIGNQVKLAWTTATEKNNLGFEIQRSIDNKEFSMVGYVKGTGTTTESHSYSYSDKISSSGKYYYRLKQLDLDGSFEYSSIAEVSAMPEAYTLSQNYPNPFNPVTTINFALPEAGNIRLVLYDVLGHVVKELLTGNIEAGYHQVKLDGSELSSGVYFYRLEAGSFVDSKKLMLMK